MAHRLVLTVAVAACLTVFAAAQIPASLPNPGAPYMLEGAFIVYDGSQQLEDGTSPTIAGGWSTGGQYTAATGINGGAAAAIETGLFTSYECGDSNGTYIAIVQVNTTAPNGTTTSKRYCEVGGVDEFTVYWDRSETACPTANFRFSLDLRAPLEDLPCGSVSSSFTGTTSPATSPTDAATGSTVTVTGTSDLAGSPPASGADIDSPPAAGGAAGAPLTPGA